jgi:hypothetical protein
VGAGLSAATVAHPVPFQLTPPRDTLLPGRTHDNLLPRRTSDPVRRRRIIVMTVVTAAIAASALAAARVAFTGADGPSPAVAVSSERKLAEALLARTADAARTVFMQRGTYEKITPAAIAERTHHIRVVASGTAARSGQVSIRSAGDDALILATPAADKTCVFARDEPTKSQIDFAAVRGKSCTAAAAPKSGWNPG